MGTVVSYKNTGSAAVTSAVITDVLSNKLKYLDGDNGCTYASGSRTVTCNIGLVAAGASSQKAFRVEVLDATGAGDLVNTATLTPSTGEATNCAVTIKIPEKQTLKCNDSCNNNCPSQYICSNGKCRNPSCVSEADCDCPAEAPKCNDYCSDSSECPSGMTCYTNRCRNPECTGESDCTCPTTTTTTTTTTTSTPVPQQEELPTAGTSLPTILFMATGALLVMLGVLVVGL